MSERKWFGPDDAIADRLLDEGERVDAQMENGETRQIFFGYLTDDDGGDWLGFYNEDGEEVLLQDIRLVSPLASEQCGAENG